MRTISLAISALLLSGCSSGNSSLTDIPVTYRFENVRTDARSDELAAVKAILDKHSTRPAEIETGATRTIEGVQIRTISARVIVPTLADIDAIQTELEEHAASADAATRPQWSLVNLTVAYRSNIVAAGVSAMISGFATAGYTVRVYATPGAQPVEVRAGRTGMWTAKLDTIHESGWVYGVATDPAGRDKPAYFRVNTVTRRQERVSPEDFAALFSDSARSPSAAPSPDAQNAAAARAAEDAAIQQRRAREDAARQGQ